MYMDKKTNDLDIQDNLVITQLTPFVLLSWGVRRVARNFFSPIFYW